MLTTVRAPAYHRRCVVIPENSTCLVARGARPRAGGGGLVLADIGRRPSRFRPGGRSVCRRAAPWRRRRRRARRGRGCTEGRNGLVRRVDAGQRAQRDHRDAGWVLGHARSPRLVGRQRGCGRRGGRADRIDRALGGGGVDFPVRPPGRPAHGRRERLPRSPAIPPASRELRSGVRAGIVAFARARIERSVLGPDCERVCALRSGPRAFRGACCRCRPAGRRGGHCLHAAAGDCGSHVDAVSHADAGARAGAGSYSGAGPRSARTPARSGARGGSALERRHADGGDEPDDGFGTRYGTGPDRAPSARRGFDAGSHPGSCGGLSRAAGAEDVDRAVGPAGACTNPCRAATGIAPSRRHPAASPPLPAAGRRPGGARPASILRRGAPDLSRAPATRARRIGPGRRAWSARLAPPRRAGGGGRLRGRHRRSDASAPRRRSASGRRGARPYHLARCGFT